MSQFARIAFVALLAVLAQSPQGTQPPTPSQQPPRFRGGTNLVRVDAFVTKNGVPVQDLKADDFEIFEDGAPQTIENFEHIVIEPAPPGERVDPSSVDQAIRLAADPHRRVFVIYLDTGHVDLRGAHDVREPLVDFMNRVMGDDDLIGVMTPEMGPQQITFGRKTDVIERGLRTNWTWGRRNDYLMLDDREKLYDMCFPGDTRDPITGNTIPVSALTKEMIDRRREKMVLDSLSDLARYMEAIRDGRTAVVAVSSGWVLFKPDPAMLTPRKTPLGGNADPMPGAPPPVGVGRGGTLTMRPENTNDSVDRTECDKDRYSLANLEDDTYLRDIIGIANRANVAFYTINPAGLIEYDPVLNPRTVSLEMLSINTNGIALLHSNDLHKEFTRIAEDLTSYYLLGYYSTNPKLDGRYRTIKIRSKRPGVAVRAREGYRAASAAEVAVARAAAEVPIPEEKAAVATALGSLERDARTPGRTAARRPGEPAVFHRGASTGNQLQPATVRIFPRSDRLHLEMEAAADLPAWTGAVLDRNGAKTVVPVSAGERTDAATGQRWLTADVTLAPLGAGDYVIELTSTAGSQQRRALVAIRVTQ